jgi:6-phosphogluconolactonase (cycloisomerase 2 family)
MKIGRWAQILLVAAPLLAGCGNFWKAPSGSSGGGTSTTTLTSGYFYILDAATSQIISYYVKAGTLTQVGTRTVPSTPIALAVAPNNNYLCVSTFGGIYTYTLSSGVLSTSWINVSSDPAVAMVIDPASSSWIIETSGQGTLYAVSVNSSTGEVGTGGTKNVALTGGTIHQLAISPDDGYVFVAADSNGTAAFDFNSSTGSLGSAAYATISGTAYSVAVDPSQRLLYIGQTNTVNSSGGLRAFTIGTSGVLSEISGSPIASGGTNPYAILPESAGSTVYVANWNATSSGVITGFTVTASGSSYTLTKLSATTSTGSQPLALAEDSSGQFVFAINTGTPYLDIFTFDSTTTTTLDSSITSSAYVPAGLGVQY